MMTLIQFLVPSYHAGLLYSLACPETLSGALTMLDKKPSYSLVCTCISRLGFDKDR